MPNSGSDAASDAASSGSDWGEDRFATDWKGPHDPRAMSYAAENGISYYHGGGRMVRIYTGGLFGTHFEDTSGGAFDPVAFQEMNEASDTETRARHEADPERDTGTADFSSRMEVCNTGREAEELRWTSSCLSAKHPDVRGTTTEG
jgi:hypothetical protein